MAQRTQQTIHAPTTLATQMRLEGAATKADDFVLVIGATNRPQVGWADAAPHGLRPHSYPVTCATLHVRTRRNWTRRRGVDSQNASTCHCRTPRLGAPCC